MSDLLTGWALASGAVALGTLFVISPASNILNLITVPLGYEWSSCPYCPDVGVRKITYSDCAVCGSETVENFSASRSPAGTDEWLYVCGDCSLNDAEVSE